MRITATGILLYMMFMVGCPGLTIASCMTLGDGCGQEQCDAPSSDSQSESEIPCADCICCDCCSFEYVDTGVTPSQIYFGATQKEYFLVNNPVSEFYSEIWNPPDVS